MESDQENPSQTPPSPPSQSPSPEPSKSPLQSQQDNQNPPPLLPPPLPPAVLTPRPPPMPTPPIAPIPVPRPLAPLPLPVRPRPPPPPPPPPPPLATAQKGSASDSDSDRDDNASAAAPNYEISEESKQVRERQEKAMQDFLLKRRAFALAVPTNDSAVRSRLRRLGEPITLFGEREMERRDRLRMMMVRLDAEGQLDRLLKAHEDEEADREEVEEGEGPQTYPFYTEGSRALLEARIRIAKYSIARAKARIARAKRRRDDPDEDEDAEMDWAVEQVKGLVLDCSELGEDRPLTGCSFSPDGSLLATWYVCLFVCMLTFFTDCWVLTGLI